MPVSDALAETGGCGASISMGAPETGRSAGIAADPAIRLRRFQLRGISSFEQRGGQHGRLGRRCDPKFLCFKVNINRGGLIDTLDGFCHGRHAVAARHVGDIEAMHG